MAVTKYDRMFAAFLRQKRGELTYRAFSRKLGVSYVALHHWENQQRSASIGNLCLVAKRLKCSLQDIFPGE
jgi:transcriptional regulator with XRE-family HTH domain